MAVTSLINTMWSQRLLYHLNNTLVYGNAVNTDYTGDAVNAGVVKINQIGDITVGDYSASNGTTAQAISSVSQDLLIDRQKYFDFMVDDFDKARVNVNLVDSSMQRAAYALGNTIDQDLAGLYTQVPTGSFMTSSAITTAANAYDFVADLATQLSVNNVPNLDRFVILPTFVGGLITKDIRWTNTNNTGLNVLQNGLAQGTLVGGMKVYFSNNVPKVASTWYPIAGTKQAVAFVQALKTMEQFRSTTHFADEVRGQVVYGCKVIQPNGIVVAPCTKS